jgi:hypothetical protein
MTIKVEHAKVINLRSDGTLGASLPRDESLTPAHFQVQILRVLMCTARFLANSPGGLRFKAATRPWLTTLSTERFSG